MTTDLRTRTLPILRDGRVSVRRIHTERGERWARAVEAHVVSSRDQERTYVVDLAPDTGWTCTCKPLADDCAHIAATKMVTGWPTPARRP